MTYQDLDLSLERPLVAALLDSAEEEAKSGSIPLSSVFSASKENPGLFTPRMLEWYGSNIAALRHADLQAIRHGFQEIDLGKGQSGFLLEAELSEVEAHKNKAIRQERDQFYADAHIQNLSRHVEEASRSYENMKGRNGGEAPKEMGVLPYFLGLVLFAIPEGILNNAGFSKIGGWVTPAVAVAITTAVAVAIGFSSHIVGEYLKQWRARFGGDVDHTAKWQNGRFLFGVALPLFTIALGVVAWGRNNVIRAEIERKLTMGGLIGFDDYLSLWGSLAGNVLIWMFGIALSYVAHSDIPDFGATKRKLDKLERKLEKAHGAILKDRVGKHIQVADRARRAQTDRDKLELRNRSEYRELRTKFEQFRAVDQKVLAILGTYRNRLIAALKTKGGKPEFVTENLMLATEDTRQTIDPTTYQGKSLELPYA